MQYGARRGWYHIYILPLICLEHERGDLACLGALDALALVCVGCGACAAQLAQPRPRPTKREADADQALALRGLLVGGMLWRLRRGLPPVPGAGSHPRWGDVRRVRISCVSFRWLGVVGVPARAAVVPGGGAAGPLPVRRVCGVWRAVRGGLCVEHEGGARESRWCCTARLGVCAAGVAAWNRIEDCRRHVIAAHIFSLLARSSPG